jgi:hypothetical protein
VSAVKLARHPEAATPQLRIIEIDRPGISATRIRRRSCCNKPYSEEFR